MKNVLRSICIFGILFLCLAGCKNNLLPRPDLGTGSLIDVGSAWGAPQGVTASQGLKGKIDLQWTPVKKAVRYYIYKADTPFSNYVQIGETSDSTASYSVVVSAGTDAYFKLKAVDINGKESSFSTAVRGTSLARPVISDIVGDSEAGDTSVTVYWYMNNLDAYSDNVRYDVVCLDSSGKEQLRISVSSGKTEALVSGLVPNTTYLYQVEAYNVTDQSLVEESDAMTAQTARRLRPDAPESLTVSQGAYGDKVSVSFNLPGMVDVAVEKNVYEQKPLYFKIYRKLVDEEDSSYIPVCSYFGAYEANTGESGTCFAGQYTPDTPDSPYKPGARVTWEDVNIERGRQYVYKVQSYTDIESRVITSDKSIATSEPGWAVAPLSFEMDPVIYDDEYDSEGNPVSHKTANLSATLTFDTLGKADSYTYELTVNYRRRNNEDGSLSESTPTKLGDFFTVDELSDHIYKADLHANPGSYSFTVNAKHKTSGWTESITTPNSRYVVPDLQPLIVQNLVVQDGYPDKFVLTWDRDPSVTYEIKYKMEDAQGGDYTLIEPVLADEGADPGQTQPFEYPLTHYDGSQGKNAVTSGDALRIEIVPYTDYQGDNHKAGTPESPDQLFYTLGTPAVTFDQTKTAADSITVTWPKIEKATSYEVTYAYDGVSGTTQILRDGVATTFADAYKADTQIIPVTKEEEIQVTDDIICVIPKPIGYDYMAYSGKNVTVTVKAINETRKTDTTGTATTRTLGPAAAGVSATVAAKESSIDVSWKEVPGATGYLIARTRYGATNTDDSRSTDGEFVYFYDGSTLSVVGQDITLNPSIKVTPDGDTFTLADTYTDSTGVGPQDTTYKFRIEQDKLGWGYPYRYQVFPVTANSTSFDRSGNLNLCTVTTRTTLIDNTGKVTYQDGEIAYQDADRNYATGSAIGYGLDVKATKAESADTVTVTWTKPYLTGTNLTPKIYRSELNSASWTDCSSLYDGKLNSQSTNVEVKASYEGANKTVPYKYIVTYSDSSLPNSTYQNLLESTKENGESINIGYYFAIENISVSKNKEVEEITIPRYNLQERKQGPDGYRLYLTNVDHNEGKEVLIGEFDKKLSEFTPDASLNGSIASSYTPDLISNKPTLKLTPIFDSATERHSGILNIDKGYKHTYRLEAYRSTETSEAPVTTNVSDWGTRKLTHSEFLYLASKAINEGVEVVGNSATMGDWSSQSAKWYSHMNNTVLGTSSGDVHWWGFVFKDFKSENSVFAIRGRLGANTNGSWKRPKMYFTNMTGGGKPAWLNNDHSNYSCGTALKISGPTELNGLFDGYISFIDVGKTGGGSIVVQFGENPSDSKTYTDGFVKWTTLVHD